MLRNRYKDKACKSPITEPEADCIPEAAAGLYFEKATTYAKK